MPVRGCSICVAGGPDDRDRHTVNEIQRVEMMLLSDGIECRKLLPT